ncbi:aminoacylase, putative [Leishmania donovani]|uniref:Aminoacylase, putative n=1 Tax=Leishmania donovani TaxID=5661 RepID=E9BEX1_LEIDO|nr:aminoacylase, putative [Leishmania donovani]CBZ33807.1 aminoacylase, putative [Leishmania donovani]
MTSPISALIQEVHPEAVQWGATSTSIHMLRMRSSPPPTTWRTSSAACPHSWTFAG